MNFRLFITNARLGLRLLITNTRYSIANSYESPDVYTSGTCQFSPLPPAAAGLKHAQLLRISPFIESECIADADLRQKDPERWFSENTARVTTWLQEYGFDCHPVVPVGCGWYCLFDLNEETIKGLIEAGTCEPFDKNNTELPFLDYMKVQQGLEVKAVQLMELRLCLSLFRRYTKEIDPKVLRFGDVLKAQTEMEMVKEGQAMK